MNRLADGRSGPKIVVLGGGPAGASFAALVAREGIPVTIYERDTFPRFHIGESLITETWWIFDRLGIVDRLEKSPFPRKYSVQFFNAEGRGSRPFYFNEVNPHESAVTWQVERSEFDALLLERAGENGAEVEMGVEGRRVLFDGDRAVGVRLRDPSGEERDVAADVVVDASGTRAIIARQLGLVEIDEKLRKAAIFAHYRGAHRDAGMDEGATLIISTPGNRGWFWYIPLSDDRVSVGVVGESAELLKGRGRPEQVLAEEIQGCAVVRDRLKHAERCSAVRVLNDFSYRSRRIAGDGWVLLGDAFGFIDPVYSTGVFLALKSAEMAADALLESIREGDLSGRALGRFGPRFAEGMESMRKLVHAFYAPGFSFADFVRKYPEHSPRLIDLLTGNVYKPGIREIFSDLAEFCEIPDDRPLLDAGSATTAPSR